MMILYRSTLLNKKVMTSDVTCQIKALVAICQIEKNYLNILLNQVKFQLLTPIFLVK